MSNTAKNLILVLGIITVVFAGYYFLTQESSLAIRTPESEQQLQQMLARTQVFVSHRQRLDAIEIDLSLLHSNEFRSLRSFAPEPNEFLVGRTNPFTTPAPERPVTNVNIGNVLPSDQ